MKLRAQIVVEVEVGNFVSAASHEQIIQAFFENLRKDYEDAYLEFHAVRSKSKDINLRKMRTFDETRRRRPN